MPEGDTVLRAARALHHALSGRTVVRFESVFPHLTRQDHDRPLRGQVIDRVTARGKHLLMCFTGDVVLRTHLRMSGSWHLYRPGERWMRPGHEMRIMIATDAFEAVAFNVPVAEFIETGGVDRQQVLRDLGPDVLAEGFDAAEAIRRIETRAEFEIADALLDQTALAGIGNIFKSEILYACRVNPFTLVRDLPRDAIEHLTATAVRLMRASASGTSRMGGRLGVYGRAGRACRRCGGAIARRKQGPNARSTYWCERCQPSAAAALPFRRPPA